MLDLNMESEQKNRNYGPVPAGSKVMVRISVETPKYGLQDTPWVAQAKSGLLGLWCKFTVVGGLYDGVEWYDNLWLPAGYQNIRLNEGQTTTCNRSGAQIRAIIEAHRGINPKATDDRSIRGRQLAEWTDMQDMEFPAKLGISKEPYEKDGKKYWNNYITSIITPDKEEYMQIKSGKEFITDGPVTGEAEKGKNQTPPEANTYGQPFPAGPSEYDDVPF